jgi:nitroimidazol reductase NimA-like FMN-containing flavoprotein (pyridoxamine 5'-phosphate oxidase superfamily)
MIMAEPQRMRPKMQDYGIAEGEQGLMSWEWVCDQMEKSRNYWICSTRPDGKPHAAPVWGVWVDNTLYFSSGRISRKGRNLAANPAVVVHLESGDDAVIFEGVVEEVPAASVHAHIVDAYAAKYPPFRPDPASDPGAIWFALRPQVAFGWLERDFPNTATRWEFEG